MQSSYPVNPFHKAINCTIDRALAHFSKRLPMKRRQASTEPRGMNPGAAVSPGVAIEDWDMLFTAVKTRLTLTAQSQSTAATQPVAPNAAQVERLCATVLDCVAALDHLHMTVRDELDRRGSRYPDIQGEEQNESSDFSLGLGAERRHGC